jgi:hypothetical protein
MNKLLKDMLVGVILGDAHIGKIALDKAFITFEQSSKKMEYLNHLHTLIKDGGLPLTQDSLKEYIREDSRYNVRNSSLYFKNSKS